MRCLLETTGSATAHHPRPQVELCCRGGGDGTSDQRVAGTGDLDLGHALRGIADSDEVQGHATVSLVTPPTAPAATKCVLRFHLHLVYEGRRPAASRLPVSVQRHGERAHSVGDVGKDDHDDEEAASVASGDTETVDTSTRRHDFRVPRLEQGGEEPAAAAGEEEEDDDEGHLVLPKNAYTESLQVPKGARKFTCAIDLRSIKRHKSMPHALAVRTLAALFGAVLCGGGAALDARPVLIASLPLAPVSPALRRLPLCAVWDSLAHFHAAAGGCAPQGLKAAAERLYKL